MLVTVGIGLLGTRLLLGSLGKVDAGLFMGFVATAGMFFVLGDGLQAASDRALAYQIGKGDRRQLAVTFKTALVLFVVAAVGTLVLGAGAAFVVVGQTNDLPPERAGAAVVAFVGAAATVALASMGSPFRSMLTAHQSIVTLTALDVLDAGLKFGAIALTFVLPTDRLATLALLTAGAQTATTGLAAAGCLRAYPEARPGGGGFSKGVSGELLRFAFWSIIGNLSPRLRSAGPSMLLLSFYGAKDPVNAALGAANQVAAYQQNFASAIARASQAAVVTAEGRGDGSRVADLINLVNKYSMLLTMVYLVPIVIEAPALLRLWLGESAPPFAVEFVRLGLLTAAVPWAYMGLHLAVLAKGRIGVYMLMAVAWDVVAVGVSWGLLKWSSAPPWGVSAVALSCVVVNVVCLVAYGSRLVGIGFFTWVTRTWWPLVLALVPGAAAAWGVHAALPEGVWRVLAVGVAYVGVSAPFTWFLSMARSEREHFSRVFARGVERLRAGGGAGA